ncbi:MAG: rfbD [Flavisolibacter sp.]|jgi:dTDP-4-dehydrorhamnose reductase|nr:rfbD [Flavisolibacter sp.]
MQYKQKILVTGSNGQLGSEIKELASSYPAYDFHFFTRAELSLDSSAIIEEIIAEVNPDYLINCAAYTAVDKAETEKEQALQINGTAVGIMAEACAKLGAKFIHISTDYVFDGSIEKPLQEDAPVSPVNYYGESKSAGEQVVMQANAESIIIRTSWVYSFYGKNFVKTMMRLMSEKESINVVGDQWGSPTYAADLAVAIMQIITSGKWVPGIYHFSNEGVITWAQFAGEIASLIQSPCVVNSIPTSSYPTPAKRPLYSVMDKTKIQTCYGIDTKNWKESLAICVRKLTAK